MIEGRPSRTALGAAARRAMHRLLDDPLILDDPLALAILPPEGVERVRRETTGRRARGSSRLRGFLAARSRVAEDWLASVAARGVDQYVILGAGLDTFAYRSHDRFPSLRVFEVDHPATQAWKRERLVAGEIAIPGSVVFVPVDFTSDSLMASLVRAGFDPARPACFAWLGVTMYLHQPDVMATLSAIAGCASGTSVVFDYMVSDSHLSLLARWFVGRGARRVARHGEPWVGRFDPPVLAAALHRVGFGTVTDLGPDDLYRRFFQDRTDGLRIGPVGHVVIAEATGG
ncbi:MAG TPA: class I SAM-dependent methyltransferase [Gemmatimonadales bacterium]